MVEACDLAAYNACLRIVKLLAMCNHAWLRRLWRCYTVTCRSGSGGFCSSGRCCGRTADNTNAYMDFGQHVRAIAEYRVPSDKVLASDLLVTDNLTAYNPFGNPVKPDTIFHHPRLSWLKGFNAIPGTSGGGGG